MRTTPARLPSALWLSLPYLVLGCPAKPETRQRPALGQHAPQAVSTPPAAQTEPAPPEPPSIAFADRTSQAYLLLVRPSAAEPPTRAALAELVRHGLAKRTDEPEVNLLLELISMESTSDPGHTQTDRAAPRDLLGLHIDAFPREQVVPEAMLADPLLTRELSAGQRQSLPERTSALLLRADYRNEHAVRGLRLLQTLVQLVAQQRDALIHDPDTGETMDVATFTRRRLQARLGNVADQVVVIPFADKRHGEPWVRLSTRGMRRFGSVELELDGLPRDQKTLERATMLLYGVAYNMVQLAQLDPSGYPYELTDVIEVTQADAAQAYSNRSGQVPRCSECPRTVDVHIVSRPAEGHDPQDYPVARIVAPPAVSGASDYDQRAWVREALERLLGPAS